MSAAELTRVSAGRAEIKVRTRAAPAAIAAALSRTAGTMITLSDVQISGDTIRTKARLRTAAGAMVGFDTVCEKHAVISDSAFAVEKLKELTQRTGATNLLTWFNIGTVPHAAVKASMEQFASEVMPKI